ncbi:TetR/AcrR family transcriptional regulator [Actinomadura sp. HBU206391]|uniref:TetR/AcrR family transcriptional regulator n=1 Tax=Actinomadura sp. HBU206391 TaxID=2731692 RepID=UPI00164F5646|nr:TetR/AcrR family transcriptional regulator [Actinomadura sp. HBU206391]MBC6461007.1 TetR/AcrR family transcriptional regulator [Actinomadura sp. HBU206391]
MPRGRPPSAAVDHAVRKAVLELLGEVGYRDVSVERVARRAGVGKAAIYRRWRSKADLVCAFVFDDLQPPPDQGSLRADLTVLAGDLVGFLTGPAVSRALLGLTADLRGDPALAERLIARHRRCLAAVLDRAVARGELAAPPDPAWAHAQLLGPAYAWFLLFDGAAGPDLPARLATDLVNVLRGEAGGR